MYKKFERGQDPEIAMESGIFKELGIWLSKTPLDTSGYVIRRDKVKKVITIDVVGDVVLEDIDIVNIDGIKGIYEVKFNIANGQITKLYELSTEEIYSRIKDYYESVLDKCLGKTIEEQYEIIFGNKNRGSNRPTEKIEDREDLIRNFSEFPTTENNEELEKIANEVLKYELEYTQEAMDEFSVKMKQYSEELLKRLKNS